jgi:two-component system sensor histidine kinase KdpD
MACPYRNAANPSSRRVHLDTLPAVRGPSRAIAVLEHHVGAPQSSHRAAVVGARAAVGLAGVIACTAFLVAVSADLTVALSVVMLAVVCASVLGYGPGIAAAVAAFAALNYFFARPIHSFAIDRTDDLIALVVFLVIAVVVATGVARLNRLRVASRLGEREARLRLAFTHRLMGGAEPATLLQTAVEELVDLFELARCDLTSDHGRFSATGPRSEIRAVQMREGERFCLDAGLGRDLSTGELNMMRASTASIASALEQIRLHAEARDAQLQSELARSRAGFLTAVTHDLRTPLATIKAGTRAVLDNSDTLGADDARKILEIANDESARLERLITNVLEITRVRSGAARPEPVTVSAADLVRVAGRRLRRDTAARAVSMDIAPDLPPLQVDPGMLEHVLVNLLENALRYSPPDTPIEIRAECVGNALELRIIDHGDGIAEADRGRIFEEFVRLDVPGAPQGTGLGLAIVKEFVELSGGHVRCEESPGGGATFVVTLPVETQGVSA